MANERVLRPAGLLESYHIARQDLKLDSNVLVAGRFLKSNNPSTRLTRQEVYPALVHALKTHAALSVRAVRPSGVKKGYVFERLETVNLEKAVRFLDGNPDEDDVVALIQDSFTQPIASDCGPDAPLWRLTITPNNLVVFAWHHCIADGQSGLAFLQAFLEGLNTGRSTSLVPPVVKTPTDVKLTPPIESLTDLSVPLRTLIAALAGIFIPRSISLRRVWTGKPSPSTPVSFSTRARLVSIPPSPAGRILTTAREHKTTLTAVLYLLSVNVLAQLIVSRGAQLSRKDNRLLISLAASLRPLTNIPPTAMGELVSAFRLSERLPSAPSPHTTASDLNWDRAASVTNKLRTSLPQTRQLIGSLKYLYGAYEGFLKGKLGKKRERSLELSNLGAFKPSPAPAHPLSQSRLENVNENGNENGNENENDAEKDAWTITESYFAQDDCVTGAALKLNCVGSPSGSVNITLTWGESAVDDDFAEAFVRDLRLAIDNFVSQLASAEEKRASS